jgi:hypothetical protein
VQDRINEAGRQVDDAIWRVQEIMKLQPKMSKIEIIKQSEED